MTDHRGAWGMWRGENSRFFARSHSFRPIPSRSCRLSTVSSRRAAALDTQFTAFPFLSSVPDIPDIPENIKGCQALQIVDFSSNPIPR